MSLKRTPLYDQHIKLSAKLVPFAGFDMPIQYKNIKDEVAAVRSSCGIFDVSHMGEFLVTGPEAVNYVDYLITNDLTNLPNNKAVYSPLCREDGKILDDLIAYKLSEQKILICVNASNMEKDWQWVSRYASKFDCKLDNISDQTALIAVQGPDAQKIINQLGLASATEKLPYYGVVEAKYKQSDITISRTGYTGEDGFEVFCPNSLANTLWEELVKAGAVPCGLAARDILRLEACYPLYGNELDENISPLDAGLQWTVKLNKPTFIGKESIASCAPQLETIRLSLENAIPRKGYPILDKSLNEIGTVTSGTHSFALDAGIAMGHIQKKLKPSDGVYFVQVRGKATPAKLHKKNFIVGGHK